MKKRMAAAQMMNAWRGESLKGGRRGQLWWEGCEGAGVLGFSIEAVTEVLCTGCARC
jgi:hypothetical protein